MSKKSENIKNLTKNKEKVSGKKGGSRDSSEKRSSAERKPTLVTDIVGYKNLGWLEERRKILAKENDRLLADEQVLQEEVLRLKSKIDKYKIPEGVRIQIQMEELKNKVKHLIPEDKHCEFENIFQEWMIKSQGPTITEEEKTTGGEENVKRKKSKGEISGKLQMRTEIERLKKQIETFKDKMSIYKESHSSTPDLALAAVKEEIRKVREEILKWRVKFSGAEDGRKNPKNQELIQKLDEVKDFLEKLK